MKNYFYVEWHSLSENFYYNEIIDEDKLMDRFADRTIKVTFFEKIEAEEL